MNDNIKKILEDSNYINKQLFDDIKNSSQYRWENKEIKHQLLIYKPSIESLNNITPPKTGELFINNDIHDENNCSLEIKTNGIIKNGFSRSTCGIVINFKICRCTRSKSSGVMFPSLLTSPAVP